jgi:8-oxo-dGTP pyrophosphatase MutT (NUDIX family)
MRAAGPRLITGRAADRASQELTKFFRRSQIRKRRQCEQVAAVCYRICDSRIEFLLVQTRSGRWTFPKGGVEPGLTYAQAAALEGFEEAGVHGRIEEAAFARYARWKKGKVRESREAKVIVHAFLCEVLHLVRPPESNRKPTWFSAEKSKQQLKRDRTPRNADELARVVDHAVARIQRLHNQTSTPVDPLQRVQFEAARPIGLMQQASWSRYLHWSGGTDESGSLAFEANAFIGKILQIRPDIRGPAKNPKQLFLTGRTATQKSRSRPGSRPANRVLEDMQSVEQPVRTKSNKESGTEKENQQGPVKD